MWNRPATPSTIELSEVVDRIITRTRNACDFWSSAEGWAPVEAANLLSRSRLDRQAALTTCLKDYVNAQEEGMHEGHLILAWVGLGALVEGSLKLFLSVFYKDYQEDVDGIVFRNRRQEPDRAMLAGLIDFFDSRVWLDDEDWTPWLREVQQYRNAIHAYRNRNIGDWDVLHGALRTYLRLLRRLDESCPYPPDADGPPYAWELGPVRLGRGEH